MENSFFEYGTRMGSDSENEIIDDSFNEPSFPKTPTTKNQTVFVPESDDSTGDESEKENTSSNTSKSLTRMSSNKVHHVVLTSDDDNHVSPKSKSKSPSVNPSPRNSDSFIGRKKKKLLILLDSESDNSFVKEHTRKKKCLKDTPVKIDAVRKNVISKMQNMSIQSSTATISEGENDDESDYDDESQESEEENQSPDSDTGEYKNECSENDSQYSLHENQKQDNKKNKKHANNKKQSDFSDDNNTSLDEVSDSDNCNKNDDKSPNDKKISEQNNAIPPYVNEDNESINERDNETSKRSVDTSDDGLQEEQLVMSRATRMSIMGVLPKENDSDDSDYIESDNTNQSSRASSMGNIYIESDNESHVKISSEIAKNTDEVDSSRITCSPISSPLCDVDNEIDKSSHDSDELNNVINKTGERLPSSNSCTPGILGLDKVLDKVNNDKTYQERVIDDDVTIIDREPEIIALSSDDEDEVIDNKKSSNIKKLTSDKKPFAEAQLRTNNIKQFLVPASYPNQNVVYVKKHVRENELNKLNALREDLQNVKHLLDNMDLGTLPDRGAKLLERLAALERDVHRQGDKVANMLVEPDMPTEEQMSKDGFDAKQKGLTWDDIQKASNAVQPRMFGKQAMATHMAERNMILARLQDLYESHASRPSEQSLAGQPANVTSELMEHQLHALAWLQWRETQRPRGGILADDMGLGKTITMISLIVADKEGSIDNDDDEEDDGGPRMVSGGTLVVCPATLAQQWAGEVGKHCAKHALSVCLHHGAARASQPHRLAASDLVITTYNILQRESEKNGVLLRVRWRRVILDEAHVVRNHKSATSQAVCGVRAARRWALTGTPLHNKDLDLFALLKFLRCTPFDDLTMWKKWIDNKSLGGSERLNTVMSCLMLRRTKQQLQDKGQLTCLPQRSAHEVPVALTTDEMNVYQKVLVFSKTLFAQFLQQRAEKQSGLAGTSLHRDSEYAKMHKKMIALQGAKPVKSHEILVLLLRLRQVCCHCGLIAAMLEHGDGEELAEDPGSTDLLAELNKLSLEENAAKRRSGGGKDEEEVEIGEGTTAAEAIKSVLSSNNPVFSLERQSSKIKAVMECLNKNVFKNKGEKAVVVSQWTSVLGLVERELRAARVRCVTLRGDVPVPARAPLVAALNDPRSDVRVMLLSLCAGGVGLNLCGASHLLLLDPHWNPQLEEQAQDRIYRVGQTKHVHIYRFMCVDTVEQSIRQLQKDKLDMAENVLVGAKNTNSSKLTIEDLNMLFTMGAQPSS